MPVTAVTSSVFNPVAESPQVGWAAPAPEVSCVREDSKTSKGTDDGADASG